MKKWIPVQYQHLDFVLPAVSLSEPHGFLIRIVSLALACVAARDTRQIEQDDLRRLRFGGSSFASRPVHPRARACGLESHREAEPALWPR